MAFGPAIGPQIANALTAEPALKDYHLLPSVRGDLLARLGRNAEASRDFSRAAALARNAAERRVTPPARRRLRELTPHRHAETVGALSDSGLKVSRKARQPCAGNVITQGVRGSTISTT